MQDEVRFGMELREMRQNETIEVKCEGVGQEEGCVRKRWKRDRGGEIGVTMMEGHVMLKWEKVRSRRLDEGVEMMENIEMSRLVEVNIDELYK